MSPVGGYAAVPPDARCLSSKYVATGKEAAKLLVCESRAAKKDEAVDPTCVSKAQQKYALQFFKAEQKGGCANPGDADDMEVETLAFVADATAALPYTSDISSRRCASTKLKAVGKDAKSILKCYSKAAKKLTPVDPLCITKAEGKLVTKFGKAEDKGGCTTVGDATANQSTVDSYVDDSIALLSGVCGDDIAGGSEECDGLDDAACPGQCQLDCTCPAVCGDGVADPPEECDDGGIVGGDGCSATCELEDTSAVCAGVGSTSGTDLDSVRIASGLSSPVHVAAPSLDPYRLFIVEQPGRIRILDLINETLLGTPFLDITSDVLSGGERGLLSVAFHPDYENNRRFFVNYTNNAGNTVIARYEAQAGDPDLADPNSDEILLVITQTDSNHNGGQIAFGSDGYLYVGMGDGGGAGDPDETGQDDTTLLGKMLRLDVDVETAPFYAVPPTNPNAGAGDPLGLIWAKGLRNPWRFSFDRGTGDLYIGDVGQNQWEEVSYEPAASGGGLNFGWDIFEGDGHCFEPDPAPMCPNPPTGFTMPVLEYGHGQGCSITGGFVYRGCALPDLAGTYFYSDFCSDFIRTFELIGGVPQNTADRSADVAPGGGFSIASISSYGEDARGELYITDLFGGEVFKIVPGQ